MCGPRFHVRRPGRSKTGRQGLAHAGAGFNFPTPPNCDQMSHATVTRSPKPAPSSGAPTSRHDHGNVRRERAQGPGRTLIRPKATRPGGRGPRPRWGARPNPGRSTETGVRRRKGQESRADPSAGAYEAAITNRASMSPRANGRRLVRRPRNPSLAQDGVERRGRCECTRVCHFR